MNESPHLKRQVLVVNPGTSWQGFALLERRRLVP
jgi:hypothetical protein